MSGPYTVLGTYACGKFLSVLRLLLSWNEIWVAKSMFQLFLGGEYRESAVISELMKIEMKCYVIIIIGERSERDSIKGDTI